ncbi:plasmid IncI1-type surface exclusion protein ExcA [Salmonella enterica subsp. enterica serovar Typhimurium]|uniref:plasmid IncI1-type surface exclusion protein ExcA n=1 Tax=Salmonella enterica TaxID=28901 RepID=UPI004024ECD3
MSQKFVDLYSDEFIPKFKALARLVVAFFGLPILLFFSLGWTVGMHKYSGHNFYVSSFYALSCWSLFIILFIIVTRTRKHYKKNVLTVLESVKLEGVFEPSPNDEQFGFFQYNYFGIDVMNGTFVYIGNINERSKLFSENMLVVGFDMHNWRSLELKGNELIINMNDPRIPYITVINKNTPIFYEKLSAMRNRHYDYPHSFPKWVDFKASQATEELGQNLIPVSH